MRLPKAHQVVLGLGVAMFVFVIGSGVVPAITGWHDHSTVQREVFVNVPTAMKVAFYGAVATMLLIVAWLASDEAGFATGADFPVNGGMHMF